MGRIITKVITFLSLFGSLSTLLCCALPVTLVSIGMGATFASISSMFPQIYWITAKKDFLFILTGVLLVISFFLMKKTQNEPCPIDKNQAEVCKNAKNYSKKIFWMTVCIYIIGLLFSYIIPGVFYGL